MFNFETGKFILDNPLLWIDLAVSILILTIVFIIFTKYFKRKSTLITIIVLALLLIGSWIFNLTLLWSISLLMLISITTLFLVINYKEVRANGGLLFSSKKKVAREKVFDRHEVCEKVAIAVESLSKTKTGALITFELEDKLNEVVSTGTILNAPVTPELLTTIFYPGTRLHDGAVIIRSDSILAASVYFTPTTKALTGKFGSRHRAALGISEITDSVTIVVSEETGRVSLAVKGDLIPVVHNNLLRTLEEYLFND